MKNEDPDLNLDDIKIRFKKYESKVDVLMSKIKKIEENEVSKDCLYIDLDSKNKILNDFDKRMSILEIESGNHNERWRSAATFVIQLIWVILAAYLLTKLNLQSPAVP